MERTVTSPASSRWCLCQQSPPVTTFQELLSSACAQSCVGAQGTPTLALKLQHTAGTLLPAPSSACLHLISADFISQPLVCSFVYQTKISFSHAGFHPEGAVIESSLLLSCTEHREGSNQALSSSDLYSCGRFLGCGHWPGCADAINVAVNLSFLVLTIPVWDLCHLLFPPPGVTILYFCVSTEHKPLITCALCLSCSVGRSQQGS